MCIVLFDVLVTLCRGPEYFFCPMTWFLSAYLSIESSMLYFWNHDKRAVIVNIRSTIFNIRWTLCPIYQIRFVGTGDTSATNFLNPCPLGWQDTNQKCLVSFPFSRYSFVKSRSCRVFKRSIWKFILHLDIIEQIVVNSNFGFQQNKNLFLKC